MSKEESDFIREYKAMHEENFLSSSLREGGKDKEEIIVEIDKGIKEETSKKRMGEEEQEEDETVSAKRRCVGFVSAEIFDIFGQGKDLESCDCFSWSLLLENPDEDVSFDLDWEFVESQSFSFSERVE